MNIMIMAAFAVYFAILLTLGMVFHKRQTTAQQFIVGNRSLNFCLTALSAQASDMSSWLFMAFPAAIFLGGIDQIWIALGLLGGMFCNWQLVAKKLRQQTEHYDSCTLSTYFERRFKDTSGTIRLLTAFMALFFLTCYITAAGLIAMGGILENVFGIDYYIGISVATVVILAYTLFGGFITVAWTDLFQASFLLLMIILVPAAAYNTLSDGFSSIEAAASAKQISLNFFHNMRLETGYIISIAFLVLPWGLGYFGQPHIITKFMGIRNANDMPKAKYLGMAWQVLALGGAAFVGIVALGFFPESQGNPELIFVEMVKILFHPFFGGLVLCGVLAASLSTMDSQILVCGSVISEDLYKGIFRTDASEKELLLASRIGVCLVTVLSLGLAFVKSSTVLEAVLYAWTGLGCAFGPLVLMSLYSKTANRYGAITGILVGGVTSAAWPYFNSLISDYTVPSMIPGFFLSLFSIWAVSLLTNPKISTNAQPITVDTGIAPSQ